MSSWTPQQCYEYCGDVSIGEPHFCMSHLFMFPADSRSIPAVFLRVREHCHFVHLGHDPCLCHMHMFGQVWDKKMLDLANIFGEVTTIVCEDFPVQNLDLYGVDGRHKYVWESLQEKKLRMGPCMTEYHPSRPTISESRCASEKQKFSYRA